MDKSKVTSFVRQNMAWFILLVVMAIFTITSPNFLTYNNLLNILRQNAYIGIAATGVSLILMSGQVDISIGYQMALCGVICAKMIAMVFV